MNFYLSTNGNDNNYGTNLDNAFRSFEKARVAVGEYIQNGMSEDVTVLIEEGDYLLTQTLSFGQQDSGRDGFRVIYKAMDSQKPPWILGGETITSWEHCGDRVYKTILNGPVNTIYENGRRAVKARFPETGYNFSVSFQKDVLDQFGFKKDDIPYFETTEDLQVHIWPGGLKGHQSWFTNTINVKGIDYQDGIIYLNNPVAFNAGIGSRYYLQGRKELIINPGQFAYESATKTLYYRPYDLPIDKQNIVVPCLSRIVEFKGKDNRDTVKLIEFDGINIGYSDVMQEVVKVLPEHPGCIHDGAIYMENAKNITIKNCEIRNVGFHGVLMNGSNKYNVIYGNLIDQIGHTGVQIEGLCRSSDNISYGNEIVNNLIKNGGQLVGHGAGIQIVQSGKNKISHNRIYNFPRYAISLKSLSLPVIWDKVIEGELVTRKNAENYALTIDNIVEFNHVSNVNTDSQDTGVIEMWGVPRNYIRNNKLDYSNIHCPLGFGIYLDGGSYDVIVENNLICNLQDQAVDGVLWHAIFLSGSRNIIRNNIIANNTVAHCAIGSIDDPEKFPGVNNVIEKNIFYNSGGLYYYWTFDKNRYKNVDNNLYYCSGAIPVVVIRERFDDPEKEYTWEQWKERTAKEFDKNSLEKDPLFINPTQGDYNLNINSPAFCLGFCPIDLDSIGLLEHFKFERGE